MEGGHYMDLQKLQGCPLQEDQLQEYWWQKVQCWRLNSDGSELGYGNCSRALTSMCTWLLR